jgi:beta-glucosidase
VTNTGPRPGTEIVQCYLEPADVSDAERPLRWLAGSAVVTADPGVTATATVTLLRRAFEVWDTARRRWVIPAQDLRLRSGRSVVDLRLTAPLPANGILAQLAERAV